MPGIATYKTIAERGADPVFALDNEGRVTYANPAAERVFGYSPREFAGKVLHETIHHHRPDGSVVPRSESPIFLACTTDETTDNRVATLTRKDGSFVTMSCSSAPVKIGSRRAGTVVAVRETTQADALPIADDVFDGRRGMLALAVEAANLGAWDFDPQAGGLVWSDTKKRLFGMPPDKAVTYEAFLQAVHPEDRERVEAALREMAAHAAGSQRLEIEFRAIRPDNQEERWFRSYGKALPGAADGQRRYIGVTLDVTEAKSLERRMREASQHDALTGLPNRATLFEYCGHLLAMARRTGSSISMLFIDLDRFKPINDTHGHEVGDQVLKQVANRLVACIRQEDIAGRLGGDEFLVAIRDPDDVRTPATVAQHIIAFVSEPYHVGHLQLHVTPSIGISLFPQHSATLEGLIRYADTAMYAAKKAGRKRFKFYTPAPGEGGGDAQSRVEMRLKYAVENNELTLHYQPVLDLESKRVIGVEALLRVPVPDSAPLVPDQFLSIAEAAGLIDRLGEWVAHEACRQHLQWRNAGLPGLVMAINVSSQEFQHGSIVPHLVDSLLQSSMDPSCLQIELKETTVIEHAQEMKAALEEIRALGIRVALDDFGTGFSSVGLLSRLPLDKLKIDQSLVGRIGHDAVSQTITDTILALGRSLKLKVVGEGIESEATLDYLREQGCDQAQGYYFSRPLSADEFERWYRDVQPQHIPAS